MYFNQKMLRRDLNLILTLSLSTFFFWFFFHFGCPFSYNVCTCNLHIMRSIYRYDLPPSLALVQNPYSSNLMSSVSACHILSLIDMYLFSYNWQNGMHSICPAVWSKQRRWLVMSMICLNPLACVSLHYLNPSQIIVYELMVSLVSYSF